MSQESKKCTKELSTPSEKKEISPIEAQKHLPKEVLMKILRYVDFRTLLSCQLVCKHWLSTATNYIWRVEAEKALKRSVPIDDSISWLQYYYMWLDLPLNHNLILNHSGKNQFKHWEMAETIGKYDKWIVEFPPDGVPGLPGDAVFQGQNCCFSASATNVCDKYQEIDLIEAGFSEYMLDNVQPVIQVSDWYGCKKDCYAYYNWKIRLFGENDRFLKEYAWKESSILKSDNEWKCCTKQFRDYGPGLRKIIFLHRCEESKCSPVSFAIFGMQNRTLHRPVDRYGAKLAGACVKLVILNSLNDKEKYETVIERNSSIEHLQRPIRFLRL